MWSLSGYCKQQLLILVLLTLIFFRELKYVIQRFAEDPRQEVSLLAVYTEY